PMIMLSGALIGDTIERLELRARLASRAPALMFAGGVAAISVAWFLLWTWGSAGAWAEEPGRIARAVRPEIQDNTWLLYLPLLALVGLFIAGIARLGARRALSVGGLTLTAMLLLTQFHVAFRMSFYEGDIPRDMLIYVQSSPD